MCDQICCTVEDCLNNKDGYCQDPGSIQVEDMVSCIELHCNYEEDEEEITE